METHSQRTEAMRKEFEIVAIKVLSFGKFGLLNRNDRKCEEFGDDT